MRDNGGMRSVPSHTASRAVRAILSAGLLAGALDIAYVLIYFYNPKADPLRILKGIAAGVLGPGAAKGGVGTAVLGLGLHFTIALGASAVYYAASRTLLRLVRWPFVSGPLYGVAAWLFMNAVVLPLSANPPKTFLSPVWLPVFVAHLLCIGLPIALVVRRCTRREAATESGP